jgi:hypothetical protein
VTTVVKITVTADPWQMSATTTKQDIPKANLSVQAASYQTRLVKYRHGNATEQSDGALETAKLVLITGMLQMCSSMSQTGETRPIQCT